MTSSRLRSLTLVFTLFLAMLADGLAARQLGDAELVRRAEAVVDQMAAGQFDEVVASFDDRMRAALPEPTLRAAWGETQRAAGEFERRLAVRTQQRDGHRIALVTCVFARARVDVQVVFDADARIAGLAMRPSVTEATALPPYAGPDTYTEREIVAGTPEWPLPGALTLPVGDGPFPGVVLVHGSGEQDRDASIGPNRIFRDLAVGLASQGVAVLRYDKRFTAHAAHVKAMAPFTVKEEEIDDALAGVALLRRTAGIDPARVFVLGHSLGGMLAPRIGAADPSIAGLIVMAGAVRPLERSIVEQTRYLIMADGLLSDEERDQLQAVERMAAAVRALGPEDATASDWIGGGPASYWLDLRGYDPPELASRLAQPFFVLQGERDYQVTMDDFARWRAALESRANVRLKSYPALNHVFMAGSGPSLPSEYLTPGHVDADVVTDVARWITSIGR